jgi:hypothetical protein
MDDDAIENITKKGFVIKEHADHFGIRGIFKLREAKAEYLEELERTQSEKERPLVLNLQTGLCCYDRVACSESTCKLWELTSHGAYVIEKAVEKVIEKAVEKSGYLAFKDSAHYSNQRSSKTMDTEATTCQPCHKIKPFCKDSPEHSPHIGEDEPSLESSLCPPKRKAITRSQNLKLSSEVDGDKTSHNIVQDNSITLDYYLEICTINA